jgi:hypothetical protein
MVRVTSEPPSVTFQLICLPVNARLPAFLKRFVFHEFDDITPPVNSFLAGTIKTMRVCTLVC